MRGSGLLIYVKAREDGGLFLFPRSKAAPWGLAVGIGIAKAIDDAGLFNVMGAHFHFYCIAHCYFNKVFAKLPGNMSENLVAVGEFNPKHGSGEDGDNFAFYFYDVIVIGHKCGFEKRVPCNGIPQPCQVRQIAIFGMKIYEQLTFTESRFYKIASFIAW